MKNIFLCSILLLLSLPAIAQYVPKEKRKEPAKDSIKTPQTQPIPKPKEERKEREPLEQKFVTYVMAFPSFLPGTFTMNGGSGSLNIAYRFTEKFNFGLATSYGYQSYPAIQGNGGIAPGFLRNYGLGIFGQFDVTPNYFIWGEYSNLNLKLQINNTPTETAQAWYSQPLIGAGGKFQIGDGNKGFASMILLNPRALNQGGVQNTPYPMLVTRFLYYFQF